MSKSKEVVSYFGSCRCCLSYNYLKNMWTEYYREGETEIYANMLKECFGFCFESPESGTRDQICETCIEKLRDALAFRNLILESNEVLLETSADAIVTDDDSDSKVKVEVIQMDEPHEQAEDTVNEDENMFEEKPIVNYSLAVEEAMSKIFKQDSQIDDGGEENDGHKGSMEDGGMSEGYEDVEFLEEETLDMNENSEDQPVRKWPKKLPRVARNRRYKQYTQDELQQCLEAVRDGCMSVGDASRHYNIPHKTVVKKLKTMGVRDESKEKIYQFHKEIKSILSFTNGTPYKSTVVKYSCIYCLEAVFTDAEELRNHTRTVHIDERTKKVDIFMRPHWENEILKLDIDKLLCVVCCKLIPDWNDMLQHLNEVHNVNLDQAYTKVVPYILNEDFTCVLCKASFSNYLQLDGHMNSHYENYVCSECGDHFLTQSRLKAHLKSHEVGRFPCDVCNKVFTQQKHLRKHVNVVHEQRLNYKCQHCFDVFPSEVSRQNHMREQHLDKIKTFNCEECGKVFYWRQYYTAHKRKQHGEKIHICGICNKSFGRKYMLQEHLISHTKVKSVQCPICHKDYMTKSSLRVHILYQHRKKGQLVYAPEK